MNKPTVYENPTSQGADQIRLVPAERSVDENAQTMIAGTPPIQRATKSRVWAFLLGVAVGTAGGGGAVYMGTKTPEQSITTAPSASTNSSASAFPTQSASSPNYEAPPSEEISQENERAEKKLTPEQALLEQIKERNLQLDPSKFTGNGIYMDIKILVEEKSGDGVRSDKYSWYGVDEYRAAFPEKTPAKMIKIPAETIIAVYTKKPEYKAWKDLLFQPAKVKINDPEHTDIQYILYECLNDKNTVASLVIRNVFAKPSKRKKKEPATGEYLQVYDFQLPQCPQVENQQ